MSGREDEPRIWSVPPAAEAEPRAPPLEPEVYAVEGTRELMPASVHAPRPPPPPPADPARGLRGWLWGSVGVGMLLSVGILDWALALAERQPWLGIAALAGAGLFLAAVGGKAMAEWRAVARLRSVAEVRRHLEELNPLSERRAVRGRLEEAAAVLARHPAYAARIADWRTLFRPDHPAEKMVELFEGAVLTEADRQALAAIRRAAFQGFGLAAISPTALTDVFLVVGRMLRLLREVATIYGYRPGRVANLLLLRGVLRDAALLGITDVGLEGVSEMLRLGPVARLARPAAAGLIASQRVARFGLLAMRRCRPLPFDDAKAPGLADVLGAETRDGPSPRTRA